ncbi:DUF3828 domain-containing protein [Flavobacterium beibuense]|uniref:DUF3828 domain-containing protein n=1 Tax=Flavobacterium beibuense F44-8 TaxID=1406840 RepID=A0A0A2LKA5_9FLAO|nr:DUF3828 domain-containing protein [Flavobacterium beibuense]KGO79671.1 hypothetical protein Q763_12530 [Flavobacterium beibuense F44-8]
MKKIILLLSVLFIVSCKDITSAPKQQSLDYKLASEMLISFYTEYLSLSEIPPREAGPKIDAVIKKYCTKELADKIIAGGLELDPFLTAQDWNVDWIPTLEVKNKDPKNYIYTVCYTNYGDSDSICTDLTLIKTNEGFKISYVELYYWEM